MFIHYVHEFQASECYCGNEIADRSVHCQIQRRILVRRAASDRFPRTRDRACFRYSVEALNVASTLQVSSVISIKVIVS